MLLIENTNCIEINANTKRTKTKDIHFNRDIYTWLMFVLMALRSFDWYP